MSPIRIDINWFWIAPELVLACVGMLALLVAAAQSAGKPRAADLGGRLGPAEWLSIAGVAVAGALALVVGLRALDSPLPLVGEGLGVRGPMTHLWGGMAHDPFSAYFKVAVAVAVLLVMAMTAGYRRGMFNRPEVYALLTLATMAIFLMASASELVLIFLAIEFLSITSYVLVGYLKDDPRSAEAGIKYFLFGAVCSAIMLYGMSFLYGMTGTTVLRDIAARLASDPSPLHLKVAVVCSLMVLAGLGFKISMAPFLQWVPEAYEGAPTPVTAFLSVASKAAGFALAVRVFTVAFPALELSRHWATLLGILAIITMTWGNTAAIWQTNVKRMLAYSSIAQAGYIAVGLVALGLGGSAVRDYALPGILLYVLAYLFMNLGAFAVVIAVANETGSEEIPAFAGLAQRAPWLAAAFTFFLLSLIGIPPTAGFIAKLYLFLAAIRGEQPMLLAAAIAMAVNSAVSAYYYLNVVKQMYFREAKSDATFTANRPLAWSLVVTAAATLGIFLWAQPFIDVAQMTAGASTLLQGVQQMRQ